jgi:hypothetical protein
VLPRNARKQVFESARGIPRVIKLCAVAKNFHKIIKLPGVRTGFQSAWVRYVGK